MDQDADAGKPVNESGVATTRVPASARAPASPLTAQDLHIRMERGPCLGRCPQYVLTVSGDGHVAFEGRNFVQSLGTHRTTIPESQVLALSRIIEDVSFFRMGNFIVPLTCLPSVNLNITLRGRSHRVWHYGGPRAEPTGFGECADIVRLEEAIERISRACAWIRGRPAEDPLPPR